MIPTLRGPISFLCYCVREIDGGLISSKYFLFPNIKKLLAGELFHLREEALPKRMSVLRDWISFIVRKG